MSKYRIIKVISDMVKPEIAEFYIEKKHFWGWKPIRKIEGPNNNIVCHSSYIEAENYLIKNYTGFGKCTINGNEYTYKAYTMYY